MLIGVSVISTCLLFNIMILYLYLSKKRLNSFENKIYKILIIISTLGLLLELICCYFTYNMNVSAINYMLCVLFNRLFIVYLLTWMTLFIIYMAYITFINNENNKNNEKQKNYLKEIFIAIGIAYVIMVILSLSLPLYYYHDENYVYSYGPAVSLSIVSGIIVILASIFCVFKNRKTILRKQYLPLIVLIILLIAAIIIRFLNPGIILINSTLAIVTVLMYHSIENPDLKIIEELNRNKTLIEKSSQGNSNFMFSIMGDARHFIDTVNKISYKALKEDDKNNYKLALKEIIKTTKLIETKVNTIIDVSAMDIKNVKVTNSKYNFKQLLTEIKLNYENKVNSNVNFITNITQNLPNEVYGDSIRLKQVISSVLANAIKDTKEGFVSLDVNTIIKYDICRFIISISNSGKGLELKTINDILNYNEELKEDELEQVNTLDMDLKIVKKVVKMLGGSFLLMSDEESETKVTIVLDQKISDNTNQDLDAKAYEFSKKFGFYNVLLVDDDLEELNSIQKNFDDYGIDVIGTMYGQDCLERIRVGQKYDLIILDDEMNSINAINILEKLKENKKFKTPVIVMLEKSKLSISKHYLAAGFIDYIDKSKLDVEIKRVVNNYLN